MEPFVNEIRRKNGWRIGMNPVTRVDEVAAE
jgi:hypothetical protein